MIAWPSGGIKANVGADYDPATGLYTAPHDGTYAFHANIYKDQEVSDFVYCKIVLGDGSLLAAANVPGTAGYHVGTGSIIIHLYRGDTVAVDCSNVYNVNRFSSWMGYLVIAD